MIGVQPYIAFRGNAREAIDFYKQALGAEEIYAQTYGESPMPDMGSSDAIMHATVKIGESHVMFCDDLHSPDFSTGSCQLDYLLHTAGINTKSLWQI